MAGNERGMLIYSIREVPIADVRQDDQSNALLKFASLLKENQERLHWLEAVLVGKDMGFSMFECGLAVDVITCMG